MVMGLSDDIWNEFLPINAFDIIVIISSHELKSQLCFYALLQKVAYAAAFAVKSTNHDTLVICGKDHIGGRLFFLRWD